MPPTLLATDYIPLLRGHLELGWGLMARHALKSVRPVAIGDTVTVTGEIVDKFERKGRHYWTLRYDVQQLARRALRRKSRHLLGRLRGIAHAERA